MLKFFRILFLVSGIAATFHDAHAADGSFITTSRFLSVEDGLASREVFSGLQDHRGFIWLGTRYGLNRYDGQTFELFSKKTGLRSNLVIQILQPDTGELWLFYGLSGFSKVGGNMVDIMNPVTHKRVSFSEKFPDAPFAEKDMLFMRTTGDGNYILLTRNGYYRYLPSDKSFLKLFDKNQDSEYSHLYNFSLFHRQHAWINTLSKFYSYKDGKQIASFENPGTFRLLIGVRDNGEVISIQRLQYLEGFFKMDLEGHVSRDSSIENETRTPFLTDGHPYYSYYDAQSNSSIVLGNTLCCFQENTFFELLDSVAMSRLPDFVLYDYFEDAQHNKWVCTSSGLFIFSKAQNHFQSYFNDPATRAFRVKFNQARCITTDDSGNVYAGVGRSLCVSGAGSQKEYTSEFLVYGVLLGQNKVYAGATNKLFILNRDLNLEQSVVADMLDELWTLYRLSENRIFIGCRGGYMIYDELQAKFIRFERDVNMFLYCLARSPDQSIWGAGPKGLYRFSESGDILRFYHSAPSGDEGFLPYSDLMAVHIDKDGIFWLATNGDGLYRWDRNKHPAPAGDAGFEHYTRDDGLSSNVLYGILEDENRNLWISSDFGINRFDINTKHITIYKTEHGLNNNEFNRTSFYKAPDGRMFFGGLNGVNAFYPKDFAVTLSQFEAPLRIVTYNQFSGKENKLLDLTGNLINHNKIHLQPGDEFFTLGFQLLDYSVGRPRYAYRIEGVDEEWNYIDENSIRISGLHYGEYLLRVKAQSRDGKWSKNELAIPLSVISPFYRKGWFILLAALFAAVAVVAVIRLRTGQLRKSQASLEHTVAERTAELKKSLGEKEILLKEIHHRVKNNLQVINSMFELQFANVTDETAKAAALEGQNRVRSIALVHQQLYQSKEIGELDFHQFAEDLQMQVASIFKSRNQVVEVENEIGKMHLDLDTAIPLGLILNELLTNSYKYAFKKTGEGKIKISLEGSDDNRYRLVFEDNGPGLPSGISFSKPGTLGLQMVNLLSKQLGGSTAYHFDNGSHFAITFMKMSDRRKQLQ